MSGDFFMTFIGLFDLLYIEKRECHSLPEVIAVFASYFKMLIPFLLDHRVVLNRDCVPHEVFLPDRVQHNEWIINYCLLYN
jgi:hypothetical protein